MPVPRRFDRRPPERDTTRTNERIRVPKVRLIGADGEQVGIVNTDDARDMAREAELDLVEVAPGAKPPVARLLDYSKYRYEQEQKLKQARKHQTQVNVREIKLRPKIAVHDYNTKKGHVERFLKAQDKVKVTIMFRGREQAHPERGRDLLKRLYEDLEGLAIVESQPLQEGRNMSMLLGPSKDAAKFAKEDKNKKAEEEPAEEEAAIPAHPQAVATTPEDLAEAEASAKLDVKAKADAAAAKEAEGDAEEAEEAPEADDVSESEEEAEAAEEAVVEDEAEEEAESDEAPASKK